MKDAKMDAVTPPSWPAPRARTPIDAAVTVPGSKSISNRALILATLADGPSHITGLLRSRDTDLMLKAVGALGASVHIDPDDPTSVTITPGPLQPASIDCGLAGTVMRFIPPLAALASGPVRVDGDEQARSRPMGTAIGALRTLGVRVDGDGLPLTIHGQGSVPGGDLLLDASSSSQFVSGLLLSAPRFAHGLTLSHVGQQLPSMPHIDMTVDMLRTAGVTVTTPAANTWTVAPGPVAAVDWTVEADLSNAAAFLAAAAAVGGRVTIPRWPSTTTQPGAQMAPVLVQMGCTATLSDAGMTVEGSGRLHGIDLDLRDIGELTPTIAALCTLADSPSVLSGIGHLRGHETDRLHALRTEITRLGGGCSETDDGLVITPAPLHGGTWHAYADHRMATAGAIIGLAVDGVEVDDIATTSKTMPDFPAMWAQMLTGATS